MNDQDRQDAIDAIVSMLLESYRGHVQEELYRLLEDMIRREWAWSFETGKR